MLLRVTTLLLLTVFSNPLLKLGHPTATTTPVPSDTTRALAQLTARQNAFGLTLFQQLSAEHGNVFISPLSIASALSMAMRGADGKTHATLAEVLELSGLSQADIDAAYGALLEVLASADDAVRLDIANALFYRDGAPVEADFLTALREAYHAEAVALDFGSAQAPATINQWVQAATNGKIRQMVDRLDPSALIVLMNAVYFNGDWTYAFSESDTRPEAFRLASGTHLQVPMMHQRQRFHYYQEDGMQIVDLPYGNGALSMTVILPAAHESVDAFVDALSMDDVTTWLRRTGRQEVDLKLPRFKLEQSFSLNETLEALGAGLAFSSNADFSRMVADVPLHISSVQHKTFLDVNERGTEAAAATSVTMEKTLSMRSGPVMMHVDRPFVLLIRDHATGAILFLGKINNPVA